MPVTYRIDKLANVLIVQGDLIDRIMLERIVEGAGHDVYVASGGQEALNVYMRTIIETGTAGRP